MRVNRVERREHERRSGQDRRKMPDRKNSKMETTDRRKEEKRKEIRREENAEKRFDDQIEGRNSVIELLESGRDINKYNKQGKDETNGTNRKLSRSNCHCSTL